MIVSQEWPEFNDLWKCPVYSANSECLRFVLSRHALLLLDLKTPPVVACHLQTLPLRWLRNECPVKMKGLVFTPHAPLGGSRRSSKLASLLASRQVNWALLVLLVDTFSTKV